MKGILVLTALFAVILTYGFSISQKEEPAGKTIFIASKCSTCHSVESAEITSKSKKSTDLSAVGNKYGKEILAKYLTKRDKLNNKAHAAAFKGTDEELVKLTEWLASLKDTK